MYLITLYLERCLFYNFYCSQLNVLTRHNTPWPISQIMKTKRLTQACAFIGGLLVSVFNKWHFRFEGFIFKNAVPTRLVVDQTFKIKLTLLVSWCSRWDALQTLTELELTQSSLATTHFATREYVIHNIQYDNII